MFTLTTVLYKFETCMFQLLKLHQMWDRLTNRLGFFQSTKLKLEPIN